MKELEQIGQELSHEERQLENLPSTIANMVKRKAVVAQKAQALHRQEQPIPGSADADRREIEEADQLRLDLINAIHYLGIV